MLSRSDGRVVLLLALGLLVFFGLRFLLLPAGEVRTTSLERDPGVGPPGELQELRAEEELWYEERRARTNWIFKPTEGELLEHPEGLLLVGPIVDAATGEALLADVYVNGEPVMRTDTVALLMWATDERPVTLDVVREGYRPWGMRFRSKLTGRRKLTGLIRLVPLPKESGK